MESKPGLRLAECQKLLDILYANSDHAKLRALVADIEDLRDRLLAEANHADAGRSD